MEIGKQIWEEKKDYCKTLWAWLWALTVCCVLSILKICLVIENFRHEYLYNFLLLLLSPILRCHFPPSHIHGLLFLDYYCYVYTYTLINTVSYTRLVFYVCVYVCVSVCVCLCVWSHRLGLDNLSAVSSLEKAYLRPPQQPWIGSQLFA